MGLQLCLPEASIGLSSSSKVWFQTGHLSVTEMKVVVFQRERVRLSM